MKKYMILVLVAVFSCCISIAQKSVSFECNAPTVEEPGDPGLTSYINNQLNISADAAKGRILLAFSHFTANKVSIDVFDTNGKLVKNEVHNVDKANLKVVLHLKKDGENAYNVKITSADRIYTAFVNLNPVENALARN